MIADQSVDAAKIKEKLEFLEYRVNANTELINHRTSRFEKVLQEDESLIKERIDSVRLMVNQSQEVLLSKVNSMDSSIKEIQRFLAKKIDFNIRSE